MAWRWVFVFLFHLIPIVPFVQGYVYGGVAALLFVALPYIKTKKLSAYIQALDSLPREDRPQAAKDELRSLLATRYRWRWLTFMRDDDGSR